MACAEEEGQLNVYTSNTDMDDLIDGFQDEYDVDVNNYRANSETVLQRILQEDEAGYYGADIFETNALELGVALAGGPALPVQERAARRGPRGGPQNENWTASRFNVFVIGWNTDLVTPARSPTSLEELADPKWQGKISMEVGDVDWFTAMHDYYTGEKGMSEDEVTDLMTRLAANAQIAKGHTDPG